MKRPKSWFMHIGADKESKLKHWTGEDFYNINRGDTFVFEVVKKDKEHGFGITFRLKKVKNA